MTPAGNGVGEELPAFGAVAKAVETDSGNRLRQNQRRFFALMLYIAESGGEEGQNPQILFFFPGNRSRLFILFFHRLHGTVIVRILLDRSQWHKEKNKNFLLFSDQLKIIHAEIY